MKRTILFMDCEFVLGASKKFDRDFEIASPILEKANDGQELTELERITLLDIYNVAYHEERKIAGISSLDSSCGNCGFCKRMQEAAGNNPLHICANCYDKRQENGIGGTNIKNRHSLNMLIMSTVLFTEKELARLNVTKINRVNSSGDTPNKTYAMNMIRLAYVNKWAHFGYWAKNTVDVVAACDELGKPENMFLVQSNPIINGKIKLAKYFDYAFTVYVDEESTIKAIENGANSCNGKSCRECGYKCYLGEWEKGSNIAEVLRASKKSVDAIKKALEKKAC